MVYVQELAPGQLPVLVTPVDRDAVTYLPLAFADVPTAKTVQASTAPPGSCGWWITAVAIDTVVGVALYLLIVIGGLVSTSS